MINLKAKTVGVKMEQQPNVSFKRTATSTAIRSSTIDASDLLNSLSTGAVDAIMDDQPVIEYVIAKDKTFLLIWKEQLSEALG